MTDKRQAIIRTRIKEWRVKNGWTQNRMGEELDALIGRTTDAYSKSRDVIALDGDKGKQTVSQLENGKRNITIEIAAAYSEIFNVSLDYLLGHSDDWHSGNKSVKEEVGLSDEAIEYLSSLKNDKDGEYYIGIINKLFHNSALPDVENNSFIDTVMRCIAESFQSLSLLEIILSGGDSEKLNKTSENIDITKWKLIEQIAVQYDRLKENMLEHREEALWMAIKSIGSVSELRKDYEDALEMLEKFESEHSEYIAFEDGDDYDKEAITAYLLREYYKIG